CGLHNQKGQFEKAVHNARKAALSLRDPATKLWCRDARRISVMPTLTLDLLFFAKYLREYEKLSINDEMLDTILEATFDAEGITRDLARSVRRAIVNVLNEEDVLKAEERLAGIRKVIRKNIKDEWKKAKGQGKK